MTLTLSWCGSLLGGWNDDRKLGYFYLMVTYRIRIFGQAGQLS